MRSLLVVLLLASIAGCLGLDAPAADPRGEWMVHGTFTQERTQADVDAVCAIAKDLGQECVLMESYPEQFAFRFPTEGACRDARARFAAVPNTQVGECRLVA